MKRILSYGWGRTTYRISNGKVTEQSLNWSTRRFVGIGAGDGANGDGTDPTVPPGDSKIDLLLFPFPTVPSAAVVMHEVQRHRAIPLPGWPGGEGVFVWFARGWWVCWLAGRTPKLFPGFAVVQLLVSGLHRVCRPVFKHVSQLNPVAQ